MSSLYSQRTIKTTEKHKQVMFRLLLFVAATHAISLITWIGKINGTYVVSTFNSLDPKLRRRVYSNGTCLIQDAFGFVYVYERTSNILRPLDDQYEYEYTYDEDDFEETELTLNWNIIEWWYTGA